MIFNYYIWQWAEYVLHQSLNPFGFWCSRVDDVTCHRMTLVVECSIRRDENTESNFTFCNTYLFSCNEIINSSASSTALLIVWLGRIIKFAFLCDFGFLPFLLTWVLPSLCTSFSDFDNLSLCDFGWSRDSKSTPFFWFGDENC